MLISIAVVVPELNTVLVEKRGRKGTLSIKKNLNVLGIEIMSVTG